MGNALKYTKSGGHVTLDFDVISLNEAIQQNPKAEELKADRLVKISVMDDGPGIPEKEQDKIFERYFQLSRQHSGAFNWGTGIGLYHCRRLVQLHKGMITAANRTGEVTGSVFTVLLPVDDECYADVKHIDQPQSQNELYPLATSPDELQAEVIAEQEASDDDERPSILVVDDDVEIVQYLKTLLGQKYHVRARYDVDNALEAIAKQEPDKQTGSK